MNLELECDLFIIREKRINMDVLSLFDGMSCGRIALERAGIEVDNYYSSEIDKYAIQIANKNYPQDSDKRLGDVTKWQDWDIDWSSIDLVTGGFPCQAWSVAGKQLGDKDERGMLFWTMLDIMKKVLEHNPKANFLIENVKMKKEFEEYITLHTTQALGTVYKYLINSALVSAQNRQRYYWTNIEGIEQPEDKGILLRDILEDGLNDIGRLVNRRLNENGKRDDYNLDIPLQQQLEIRTDNKSGCLTTVQKDNVAVDLKYNISEAKKERILKSQRGKGFFYTEQDKKIGTIVAGYYKEPTDGSYLFVNNRYRKLTPLECERLQTVPDNYTEGVSNSQRYKMLGNGWTVDVIAHILKGIKKGSF